MQQKVWKPATETPGATYEINAENQRSVVMLLDGHDFFLRTVVVYV